MNPSLLIVAGLLIYAWRRSGSMDTTKKNVMPKLPADTKDGETKNANRRVQFTYEQRNQPWRWTARPEYFQRVPLAPRSAEYWRELSELWRRLRGIQIQLIDAENNKSSDPRDIEQLNFVRQQFQDLWNTIKDKTAIYSKVEEDFCERLALRLTPDEIRAAELERIQQYLSKTTHGGAHASFPRFDDLLSIHTPSKAPGGSGGKKGNSGANGKIDQI